MLKVFASCVLLVLIPLQNVAAQTATPLPNGTYVYDIQIGGKSAGTNRVTVSRPNKELQITEHASILGAIADVITRLDPTTYQPRIFDGTYLLPQGQQIVHAVLNGNTVDVTMPGKPPFYAAADKNAPTIQLSDGFTLSAIIPSAAQYQLTRAPRLTEVLLQSGKVQVATVTVLTSPKPTGVAAADAGLAETDSLGTGTMWYNPLTLVPEYMAAGQAVVVLKSVTLSP